MADGAQPAAGGQWIAAAPPNLRDRVVQKMMKSLPQVRQVYDPQGIASGYEDKVFNQSDNLQDYLRTISMKMVCLQQRWQPPVVQPASDHQQQARMGHQMRTLNANSSAAAMPGTASTIPLTVRPPQVQKMHNQAHPSNFPRVPPVVQQLHPSRPVATQIQTTYSARHNCTEQPQPEMAMMNHEDLSVNQPQSYYTHGGALSNVGTMQIWHPELQTNRKFGHPELPNSQQFGHTTGEVDWREDMYQKVTSLKDAHLRELMEFGRALRARVPQGKTNEQFESMPKEQADQYRKAVDIMAKITWVSSFLQLQKRDIPDLAKDQFDKYQTSLYALLKFYRQGKARNANKNVGRQSSQNCHELPRVNGATDNNWQNQQEQPAAEEFPQSSQNVPARSPSDQQQNHSDQLAGEAEDDEVRREAEAPVPINLTAVTSNTAPFTGGTCNQKIEQERLTDEAIPQLTQNVDPAETPPAQQQTRSAVRVEGEEDSVRAKAKTPVAVEAARTPLSPAVVRNQASDMGVNMKRAFRHMTPGTMDGSVDDKPSGERCYKRLKTRGGSLLDEIRDAQSMLVQTVIRISEDDTGGADRKVIELCYNAVALAPNLRAAIGASEISKKLLVPADYPRSSPLILCVDGEQRKGVPAVVDVAFRQALVLLPEPRSIQEMARAWDNVVRRAVMLFVHRVSGGPFSTRYGCWESCIPV